MQSFCMENLVLFSFLKFFLSLLTQPLPFLYTLIFCVFTICILMESHSSSIPLVTASFVWGTAVLFLLCFSSISWFWVMVKRFWWSLFFFRLITLFNYYYVPHLSFFFFFNFLKFFFYPFYCWVMNIGIILIYYTTCVYLMNLTFPTSHPD